MALDLERRTNLGKVFAFTNEPDPLMELYLEDTPLTEDRQAGDAKSSRIVLETAKPPETVPGIYTLNRDNVFYVGVRLDRLREEDLSELSGRSLEAVEEPAFSGLGSWNSRAA